MVWCMLINNLPHEDTIVVLKTLVDTKKSEFIKHRLDMATLFLFKYDTHCTVLVCYQLVGFKNSLLDTTRLMLGWVRFASKHKKNQKLPLNRKCEPNLIVISLTATSATFFEIKLTELICYCLLLLIACVINILLLLLLFIIFYYSQRYCLAP